ncbi:glycerol-3-phosphate 1-O-acyltransferase PlsB [Acinetobacter sp. SwsAc6]|uniref:Glycerol-3-phosphate acyltransferase n=1 Tax=Acinetobacter cumulans TaxID=2136182 RepID=A0A498D1V0_9GAMM|nr:MULTISPECIES: glycerol-3-phosphate 1-O-acyltransferase PlsB [Acinetobacter]NWK72905.1 glycerol-3-phosphate 1-O-acyltransferase PlsB [Acinetobacter sp. SwsAc6]RKG43463.1 glycerol-3-phosphate 1-O-acyltransferase PlsB [Acinetobacter cumulans]RKG51354.1 glycerol-3-phosphate 1-O-acyltransferase PlsB [Acinetobacter cumulans]RLL36056.1 glycerol-3-phosphate 1-O-acyltransferase PlsB [Acinetobacter cumulans]RZG59357.1 glycerol-3-phosphate 1-O-acyltransferase PlsB [Acinetobacter sp. WCHAc060006]
MSKPGFGQMYRKLSSKLLDLVVTPHVLGEVPTEPAIAETSDTPQSKKIVCYVLQTHSRSNALVVDGETRRLKLHAALDPLNVGTHTEKASVLFLQHRDENNLLNPPPHAFPPRLLRLVEALEKQPDLDIEFVPVTLLWGRDPEKEDSWLKLLFTDTWSTPSRVKQLMNIGLHGRQTYIEFHEPQSLRALIDYAKTTHPNLSPATYILSTLNDYLDGQREVVLGPDLSDRRNVMHGLIKAPDVQDAIRRESIRGKISMVEAERRAIGYLNEIVSDYSHSTVRFADIALTRLWTQLYDGVEVHNFSTVRELAKDYEIVYTPCHRSHIDYLLLSYVIYKRGMMVPYIAAGDNLNMPFVGQILRGGGAFFIRRSFRGNGLYTTVFKEYLYSILSRNTPLEYFIEGGRSRTGRLLPPKTGMLAMTVHSHLRNPAKPIVFLPTYIGYERLMEGATYVGEMNGKPKEGESILGIVKTLRKIERIFGKVHVNFGEPVFLNDVLKQHGVDNVKIEKNDDAMPPEVSEAVTSSAHAILENINRAAVINPVSLLSLILLATVKHTLDEEICINQLDTYRNLLTALPYDSRMQVTPLSGKEIIAYGLKLKLIKRVKHVLGDIIAIEDGQAVLLTYFRNNILHAFILPSLIAAMVEHNGTIRRGDLINVIRTLYPFLKAELFLKWKDEELKDQICAYAEALIQAKLISEDAEGNLVSPAPNSEHHNQLVVLAAPVMQSLERYYMTLALITQRGSGNISTRQVEELSHLVGQRLSVLYEFNSPEFFDKALFQSFIKVLTQQGYISTNEDNAIVFDENFQNVAQYANLVLDDVTLQMLQHITTFSDDELKEALDKVAAEQAKKRLKRKKK